MALIQEQWRGTRRENERLRNETEQLWQHREQLEQERERLRQENDRLKKPEVTRAQVCDRLYGKRDGKAIPQQVDEVIAVPPSPQCSCGGPLKLKKSCTRGC